MDKLDELLGRTPDILDAEPGARVQVAPTAMAAVYREEFLDDAKGKIRAGADIASVVREVEAKGFSVGQQSVLDEFRNIRRRYGEDFARHWLSWKHEDASSNKAKAIEERNGGYCLSRTQNDRSAL